jgi:hypothetical protein
MAKTAANIMKPAEALRAVEQCKEMLKKDRTALESRLDAAVISGVEEDVGLLTKKIAGAKTTRAKKMALTLRQNLTAEQIAALVMVIRSAMQKFRASKELKKAAGVGTALAQRSVTSAGNAADKIIKSYADYTDEMRLIGVLPKDIATLEEMVTTLRATDGSQEGKKQESKMTTAERNAVQRRLEAGLLKIIGAAELEFVFTNPERMKAYQALIPARPKRKKKPKKPTTPA